MYFRCKWFVCISLIIVFITPISSSQLKLDAISDYQINKKFEEILLKITINRQDINQATILLQDQFKCLYVTSFDLKIWHISIPKMHPTVYRGQIYYSLNDITALTYNIDMQKMVLNIHAKAAAFHQQNYTVKNKILRSQRPEYVGGYLNYDLNVPPDSKKFIVNGLFGLGIFGPLGVINHDVIANTSEFNPPFILGNENLIRLNTSWNYDLPEKMLSFRIGDSISQSGMWGNAVGFGGIQISTNFATQPRFITYPLPTIRGEAVLPSTVDLFINNARIYQRQVAPGPFDINSLPVINGQGEVSLVSRDLLGRQQIISIPYYASSTLLKPGLQDFSFALGFVRNNFGIKSFDYKKAVFTATYRRGITNNFTHEFHAALLSELQTIGFGGTFLVGTFGVIDGASAISHNNQGMGALIKIGLERNSQTFNFGFNSTYTTEKFNQFGQSILNPPPKLQSTAFIGLPLKKQGSIGLSLVSQIKRTQSSTTLLSASYSVSTSNTWTTIVSALTNIGGDKTQGIFLTLTRRLGKGNSATINGNKQNDAKQLGFQFNHNSQKYNGLDYYISALPGHDGNIQGGTSMANEYGAYSGQIARQNNITSYTFNSSGSIAYLSGMWRVTQRITNSFGVVQVPGYEGVGIYVDNQLITHTNKDGYAFVPDLRAYDDNKLSIDPTTIPMDAQVKQSIIHAVPYYHSGVLMKFDIHQDRDALMTIILDNDKYLPAGATVHIKGTKIKFPVAYNGRVYMTGLASTNEIIASFDGYNCSFKLNFQVTKNPLPDLGIFRCMKIN